MSRSSCIAIRHRPTSKTPGILPSSETFAGGWVATLDMDRIAEGLGAERRGKVSATGGYFGAMQLLADVEAKFRVPAGGGRPTDPRWTERRLVPLALKTLERLEDITAWVRKHGGINLEPMQLAALILEKTTSQLSEAEAEKLVRPQRRASH